MSGNEPLEVILDTNALSAAADGDPAGIAVAARSDGGKRLIQPAALRRAPQ